MNKYTLIILILLFNIINSFALEVEIQAVSKDKTLLALGFDDHAIHLYSLQSGELVYKFEGHENSIQTLGFNSDGSKLISGDWGDIANIWDTKTGKIIIRKNMGETVMHAIYSTDDDFLIMSIDEKPLAFYDAKLNKKKSNYEINDRLQMSKDGSVLAGQSSYAVNKGDSVIIVDTKNNKTIMQIPEDSYDDEIFISNDNNIVVIRGSSSIFHVWDIVRKKKIGTIHSSLSVDESLLNPVKNNELWVAADNVIEVWDYKSLKVLRTFAIKGFDVDEISSLVFPESGANVVASIWLESNESIVLILDGQSGEIKWQIKPMSKQAFSMEILDDNRLLINSKYPIEVWGLQEKKMLHLFTKSGSQTDKSLQDIFKDEFSAYKFGSSINGIDTDGKGNLIITGADNTNTAISLDKEGKLSKVFQNNYITGYDARYSHDGELAAFAYHGEHLLLFNSKDGGLYKNFDLGGVPSGTRIIKFSPDDSLVAAGSDDGSVSIVDVKAKTIVNRIDLSGREYSEGTFSLQWLSNDVLLVGTLEKVYELDLRTGKSKNVLEAGSTSMAAFFENNKVKFIAIGQYEDEVIVLDSQYKKIKSFDQIGVGRLALTSDGEKLIATSDYNTTVWNIKDGSSLSCEESEESIWAMAYDANNHIIYTGGDEGKVYRWDESCKKLND